MVLKSIISMMAIMAAFPTAAFASMIDTLPAGVNSPQMRLGWISGIDQKYNSESTLYKLSDINSMQLDARTLSGIDPQLAQFVEALDVFGNLHYGQSINYGVVSIDTKPQVQYTSPIYARGITNRWTVGMALPVINYKNKISISQSNSNLDYYRTHVGSADPSVRAALDLDLVGEARKILRDRGYKPVESRSESYLGDVQLVSAYRFLDTKNQGFLYTATFNLPTGPKYDADDLIGLNSFGRTGVENRITYSNMISSNWEIAPYLSHNYFFQDTVTVRVPESENDILPDQNSKQSARRKLGETLMVGGETYYSLDDRWSFGLGYSIADKKQDVYQGPGNGRYDVIEKDTEATFQRINAQIQYSTTKAYGKKQAMIPFVVAFNYMDTVAGKNIERRTLNELNLMMFF